MYYEKAYKKALELARKGAKIEEIFPELNESNGEKIRKTLIDAIGRSGEFISILKNNGIFYEDAIKWLNELDETAQKAALRKEYEKGRTDLILEIHKNDAIRKEITEKIYQIIDQYNSGRADIQADDIQKDAEFYANDILANGVLAFIGNQAITVKNYG